jgi:tetratricopeptide (TPR) repeat protein
MDRESAAQVVGVAVGIAAAAGVAYVMFSGGGGHGLPAGRYPIILLAAIFIGPPLIVGAVAGGIAFAITLAALKPVEQAADARAQRRRLESGSRIKALIEEAPERDAAAYVERNLVPQIKKHHFNLESSIRGPDVPSGYTVFHLAAAAKKLALLEALGAKMPRELNAAENGKQFDEIGTQDERDAARAAFARGYASALERDAPPAERPVTAEEKAHWPAMVEGIILRNRENRAISLRLDPGFALGIARRDNAEALLNEGQADRALPLLESAARLLKEHQSFERVLLLRGLAKRLLANNEQAIADFDAVIRRNPNSAEAYYRRARASESLGRINAAIADYDKAIAIAPDYAVAYVDRGALLVNHMRHPQLAIADFRKALELDPNLAVARNNIDSVLESNGADDRTVARLSTEIEADPSNVEALSHRANAHRIRGAKDKASADIAAVLAISPKHVGAITERYRMTRDEGKWALAHLDALNLIKLLPNETWPLSCSALCLENMGRRDEALELNRRILAAKPDDASAKDAVARLTSKAR